MVSWRRSLVLWSIGAALCLSGLAFADPLANIRRSVYKIRLVSEDPDFQTPWNAQTSATSFGTGFYIGKRRILTNAHVASNARFITVLRDGESRAIPARVLFIAHDADLALLTTDGKNDFDGVQALVFGDLPKLRSPVSAIGSPLGGEQVSVTDGIVSRIDYRQYVHSGINRHLLVQVDSAINPGNSGGPVIQHGEVVGVAFQSFVAAESTGYIIPVPVVQRFLKDVEDGQYDGHPDDGLTIQPDVMSNPLTAEFHGLKPTDGGVKVAAVASYAPTWNKIYPGDILVAIDQQPIGADGRVTFMGERVEFTTLFDLKQMGEEVAYTIVRGDKRMTVPIKIQPSRPSYQQGNVFGRHPRYFVYSGLVFEALSRSLLMSFGRQWYRTAPATLRYLHQFGKFDEEWADVEDIVVLVDVMQHAVNTYAASQVNAVVSTVDGKRVRSLAEMKSLLENGTGEFQVVEFIGMANPLTLVRKEARAAHADILKQYSIDPSEWMTRDESLPAALSGAGSQHKEARP